MASFKQSNGKQGYEAVYHTSTGYKCLAKVKCPQDISKKIEFFARHIVGNDGMPYNEIGFECNESYNRKDLMFCVKRALVDYGFQEVLAINHSSTNDFASFCEYSNPIPNVMQLRVNNCENALIKVFDAMAEFLSNDCIEFVKEQEEDVEEKLYNSIMVFMGNDLSRGPGGQEKAPQRARDLAKTFINGYVH